MDYLTKRFDMIAERILENERLTADLDDEPAQVLLDWGISSAKLIVESTAGVEDEDEADKIMYNRLRANTRLMRTVNKWVPKRKAMDKLASLKEFGKVGKHVETIYGDTFVAPSDTEWKAFLSSYQANNDVEMITNLRNLFDQNTRSLPAEEPMRTSEPIDETPKEQAPTEPPAQVDEPAINEMPKEQAPTEPPAQVDEPAINEMPKEQVPTKPPSQVEQPKEQVPTEPPAQVDESAINELPAIDEMPKEQMPAEPPAQVDEPAINEMPKEQAPAELPAQVDEPAINETPKEQMPAELPAQVDEPAINETPKEQAPAELPAQVEQPKEQAPTELPAQVDEPAINEQPKEQVPAELPAQVDEPTIDKIPNKQLPIRKPILVESPASRDGFKNGQLFGQVPTPHHPKPQKKPSQSFIGKLWGWVASFLSKR